jgi:hypothetical protein
VVGGTFTLTEGARLLTTAVAFTIDKEGAGRFIGILVKDERDDGGGGTFVGILATGVIDREDEVGILLTGAIYLCV